ncbi:class I SAM-dependent methyltransferase [Clostridium ganghwense]|uniref:Class I SAM-dependent methyltransferase n=1 Tax=Clostridium ganghwense TaxID=312089 RepID=A0ABT4CNU9_9CLOT|nr:class I SAM-dependent methyltransferase [Clostridium ganghwense]MCY6370732.1 class I SAM-dependent methyltransferase [Clostridium ganghwense]
MNFYKELSKVYDIVFPKNKNTVKFLSEDLRKNSKIIDLACGTGIYSIALGELGHEVTGIDLDEKMIEKAKYKKGDLNIDFIRYDMTKIKDKFEESKYNRIFCIGNSLVHLNTKEEIKSLINDMYGLLNSNGSIVIQTINYDRILKNNIKSLPTIDREAEGVKFIRKYNYSKMEELIYFETELLISKEEREEKYTNSRALLPMKSNEIISMIKEAGFSEINVYGSFLKEQFKNDSYALVIKAFK